MTSLPETLILVLYFFVLSILAIYGWHRYYLVYLYMKNRGKAPPLPPPALTDLPRVTIQLPIYNEMYVADRLIDAVCEMDYPRELLEIQVLDDSTDETTEIAELAVRRHAARGFDITLPAPGRSPRLQGRRARGGFEGGQGQLHRHLRRRLRAASDFLRRTLPHFTDAKIGMVQARWGHINQDYSLLTKIQSILLDAHFVLEHGGRNRAGCFFNFNGTAGVWRREAIADAGGWQHDTLTEDLDLSYRAQLRGWRFVFLPRCGRARRSAGRDELLQVPAASLGEGLDPDLHEAAAAHPAIEPAARGQGGGVLPSLGELQLPADVAAVDPDVPGDVRPLQHGLDRDAAHRRAAVLRGHAVGLQVLHRVAA